MAFSNYKSISAVAKEFQINYLRDNFIVETEFAVSDIFRNELELIFNEKVYSYTRTLYNTSASLHR
ncbi:MAG: hypothetical protein ACM65L_14335 [Microcoleus sp.]